MLAGDAPLEAARYANAAAALSTTGYGAVAPLPFPDAVRGLLDASGLKKEDIDGLTISSFSLTPDTAVGVTQHLGLSPRWLDHLPNGGASGVMALRRAARAVQAGDADIVACVSADTNRVTERVFVGDASASKHGFVGSTAALSAIHGYKAGKAAATP